MTKIVNVLIKDIIKNRSLSETYLKYLISLFFYDNVSIKIINPVTQLLCFTPLPTKFVIDNYLDDNLVVEDEKDQNILVMKGKPYKNRIIFANKILPSINKNPIPFTFPVNVGGNLELLNSKGFYYEIQFLEQYQDPWNDETLVIGYGSTHTNINSNPGWKPNTFGYHTDDGSFQYNGKCINNFGPLCMQGDIVGAGIIYEENNMYTPFFTYNGKIINKKLPAIFISSEIVPMIGFDHSHKIKYNFGKDTFKFSIELLKEQLLTNKIFSLKNTYFKKNNQKITFNDNVQKSKLNLPKLDTNVFNFMINEIQSYNTGNILEDILGTNQIIDNTDEQQHTHQINIDLTSITNLINFINMT